LALVLPRLVELDVDWLNVENNPGLPWIENGWESIKKWWLFLEESSTRLRLSSFGLAESSLHEVGLVCGSRLQSLHIKNCQISSVSPYWSLLINLSSLKIEKNQLTEVQAEPFQNMSLLSSCSVSYCSVSHLSAGFFLSKWCLTRLNLSHNKLTVLPSSVGFATALTDINLDKNLLTSLPETWTSLKSLKTCAIRENLLSNEMEDLLKNAPDLCSLDLSHNRLQNFPLNPVYHTNLQSLDVSHNIINSIKHDNFTQLIKLQKFKANDNMLHEPMLELPLILEVAADLACMDFSGNPMSSLPEGCKKNAENMIMLLKTLLSIKQTREINAGSDWEKDALVFLLVRSNACITQATFHNLGLTQHPKDIFLHDVVVLDLSYNCIDHISKELFRLSALKSLSLSHNIIKACNLDEVSLNCLLAL
jgi:Leucine-rich repeat (LRR) protein